MRRIISKISQFLKTLFLKLSVIVTLRLGKDEVEELSDHKGDQGKENEHEEK